VEEEVFNAAFLSRECARRRAPEAMPIDFLDQERSGEPTSAPCFIGSCVLITEFIGQNNPERRAAGKFV